MSFKRKRLLFAFILLSAASLLGCLLTVAYFYIPSYVESRLIPEITARLGGDDITFKVRRVHFNGTDLGPIIIGDPKQPGLEAETVRISYTPAQIYKGHVGHIVISGVTLHARYQDGVFSLRGIDIEKILENFGAGPGAGTGDSEFAQAFSIGGLALRSATVEMIWGEKTFRIPMEIRLTPENEHLDRLNFALSCYLRDGAVTATGRVDLPASTITTDFHARALELARYAEFSDLVPGLEFSGRVDATGRAVMGLEPLKVTTFSAAAQLRRTRIIHRQVTLTNPLDSRDSETPIHIELKQNNARHWALSISRFALSAPAPVHFEAAECKLTVGPDAIEGTGTFSLDLPLSVAGSLNHLSVTEPSNTKGRFEASWAATGQWAFMLGSIEEEHQLAAATKIRVSALGVEMTTGMPALKIVGSGTREKGAADFMLDIPHIEGDTGQAVFSAAGITIKGHARLGDFSNLPTFSTDVDLTVTSPRIKVDSAAAAIPAININGKISGDGAGLDRLDAAVKFTNGTVSDDRLKLRADGIRGRLPLHWPLEGNGEKGSLSVSGIKWQGRALGSMTSVFQQNDGNITFSGAHVSRVLPKLRLRFSGNAGLQPADEFEAAVTFKIPGYILPDDWNLGAIASSAKGLRMGGKVVLSGRISVGAGGIHSELKAALNNGSLSSEETGLAVDGIDVAIVIPDLLQMRSAPAQQINFRTARLGELKMDTGRVEFQIEPGGSLFIEKGSFDWCGGHVDTGAMRISPDNDDYRMILYCDRLLLAKILEQFGAVQAEGSGTLSGKIPVRLENGRLSFDDGFLYSSPGEGGTIRLSGTEILTAGIPQNTPQFTQLELAREALKDYTYQWVKLKFNTEGDTLLLRMQLDGKPAKALPFVYDKKLGGFAKVASGGQGSIFQGISLDVNFNLPLNKLLTYKDIFKNIE